MLGLNKKTPTAIEILQQKVDENAKMIANMAALVEEKRALSDLTAELATQDKQIASLTKS